LDKVNVKPIIDGWFSIIKSILIFVAVLIAIFTFIAFIIGRDIGYKSGYSDALNKDSAIKISTK